MFSGGRLIWAICFGLLLLSSPLLLRDLILLQRNVEQTAGADFWYEGQLNRELLLLKLLLTKAQLGGENAPTNADIRFQIDLAFSRLNTLPKAIDGAWHTQGIAELEEVKLIRDRMTSIDAVLPLLDVDRPAFLAIAMTNVDAALEDGRSLALRVVERQNSLIGGLQAVFESLQKKLIAYAVGLTLLIVGLLYLMVRHIRSERDLRASNQRLTEMAVGLSRARDEAVEASRAKGRFLANASHELRTPLNGILGFAEMLQAGYAGTLSEKQREYVNDIHGSARRLLMLINDILDLSKLEAGKQTLAEEVVSVEEIVRQAVHDMRETIRQAAVEVRIDAEPELPAILGDPAKLRQVVDNLLSNAVKFTPAGGAIRVSIARRPSGGLRLSVADTGIGIDKRELPKVFNAFEQVDSAYARKHKGTGLGLPLAKGFVELHGGSFAIDSAVGVGTTILVELPAERIVARPAKAEAGPSHDWSQISEVQAARR